MAYYGMAGPVVTGCRECGGAIDEKPCPRCGGMLGGRQHTLRADSYHLPVPGGASPVVWMAGRAGEGLPQDVRAGAAAAGLIQEQQVDPEPAASGTTASVSAGGVVKAYDIQWVA